MSARRHRLLRGDVLPILALGLLSLAVLFPAVVGGRVVAPEDHLYALTPFAGETPRGFERESQPLLTDPVETFHPALEVARRDVRAGRAPLWNPYIDAGRPFIAPQQHAIFHPLTWLAFVLPFWAALGVIAALKLWLGAAGAYALCRHLGTGRAAAFVGGAAYGFGTYYVGWLSHPHTNIYALIPFALLASGRLARRARAGDALLLAAIFGLAVLGGHPESFALLVAASLAFLAVETLGPGGLSALRRPLALYGGALALGLCLGAVMLVPFFELLLNSSDVSRAGPPLPWSAARAFALPEWWGRPDHRFVDRAAEPFNFLERTAYIGAAPALLAGIALALRRSRRELFFAGLVVVGLLTAFHVPGWEDLLESTPGVELMALQRTLVLVALGGAVLAALALDRLSAPGAIPRRLPIALVLVALVALPLALIPGDAVSWLRIRHSVHHVVFPDDSFTGSDEVALAAIVRWVGFAGAAAAAIALAMWRPAARRLAAVALVGLATVDVVAESRGLQPAIRQSWAERPMPGAVEYLERRAGPDRVVGDELALIPNLAASYELRDMRATDLPKVDRVLRLQRAPGAQGAAHALRVRVADPRAPHLLDLFAVRYVVQGGGAPPPELPQYRVPPDYGGGDVWTNTGALPRAWLATDWSPTRTADASLDATVRAPSDELLARPVIEGVGAPPAAGGPTARATVVDESETRVEVEIGAPRAGYLVLNDAYYPGWRAEVDGEPRDIHPANTAFRAVAVPAGRHTVEFSYRPLSVIAGAAISLAALAFLAGAAIRMRRAARRA